MKLSFFAKHSSIVGTCTNCPYNIRNYILLARQKQLIKSTDGAIKAGSCYRGAMIKRFHHRQRMIVAGYHHDKEVVSLSAASVYNGECVTSILAKQVA